jgi:predicted lipoprotein with Yx(FWY)xxD motif
MKRPFLLLSLAPVAAALAVAGCGGSSNTSAGGSGGLYGGGSPAPARMAPAKAPAAAAGTGAARVASASHGAGPMLVDAHGRTLYLFKADTGTRSACSGACATAWPPVTTKGAPKAGSGARAELLGTARRADGTTQVTYAGHPLYTFAGDTGAGQLDGQGTNAFGGLWWVVAPSGATITRAVS